MSRSLARRSTERTWLKEVVVVFCVNAVQGQIVMQGQIVS
jgi:hypothetical protein